MASDEVRKSRRCVVDAKGRHVFVGDTVADCYCEDHEVRGFSVLAGGAAAMIVDERGELLVPHLVERVGR